MTRGKSVWRVVYQQLDLVDDLHAWHALFGHAAPFDVRQDLEVAL
jgi:hypothetical protein